MKKIIFIILLIGAAVKGHSYHLLDSLPSNFSYHLERDSFPISKYFENGRWTNYFKDSITIGCYKPVKVLPEFSLSITHDFLFESIGEMRLFNSGLKKSDFKLVFYAVPKTSLKSDSSLFLALEDYCIYGQANYTFQSRDYIIFNYAYAVNGDGIVRNLKDLGIWQHIENTIVNGLNTGASTTVKKQVAKKNSNLNLQKRQLPGKYIWQTKEQINDNGSLKGSKMSGSAFFKLKRNGRGYKIVNFNQIKSNWYKDKCKWWMDSEYLYINVEGSRMEVYKIHNKNVFMHIGGKVGFRRMTDK